MKRAIQSGFTLIELIIVIVIIGILSTIAIPFYVDLREEAAAANVRGVAAALSGGAAINFAARTAGNTANTVTVANCNQSPSTLAGRVLPLPPPSGSGTPAYSVNSSAIVSGAAASCTLTLTGVTTASQTATFTVIGVN